MPDQIKFNQAEPPKEEKQDPNLRQPPSAGGPNRIQQGQQEASLNAERQHRNRILQEQSGTIRAPRRPKSKFKRALPYLIAGGSTAGGIGTFLSFV